MLISQEDNDPPPTDMHNCFYEKMGKSKLFQKRYFIFFTY